MVLYVHNQEADGIDISEICKEFVNLKDSQWALFGYC